MFQFRGIRRFFRLHFGGSAYLPVGRLSEDWYGRQVVSMDGEPRLIDERPQGTLEGKKATDGE